MDRPRSPVQDAGRWCGPFRRLDVRRVVKHEERGRLPQLGETTPLLGIYSIVSGGPRSRPVC